MSTKKSKLAAALGADILETASTLPEATQEEKEAPAITKTMIEAIGDTITADDSLVQHEEVKPDKSEQLSTSALPESIPVFPEESNSEELEDGTLEVTHKATQKKMIVSKQHFEEYRHNFS